MIDALKRALPRALKDRLKRRLFHVNDMTSRLSNLVRAGFVCTGAIDGGAYEGEWSATFWKSFPGVSVMLVEPQPSKSMILADLARRHASHYVAAALGRSAGSAELLLGETNSRVTSTQEEGSSISVAMTTIDELLTRSPSFKPNLLKLDLQGYELEALLGCASPAERFEVIISEVSVLRIGDVPIFREVDTFLEDRGFRLYDVLPQYYRPLDGALWQCDAFYVRRDSNLIASREWA